MSRDANDERADALGNVVANCLVVAEWHAPLTKDRALVVAIVRGTRRAEAGCIHARMTLADRLSHDGLFWRQLPPVVLIAQKQLVRAVRRTLTGVSVLTVARPLDADALCAMRRRAAFT